MLMVLASCALGKKQDCHSQQLLLADSESTRGRNEHGLAIDQGKPTAVMGRHTQPARALQIQSRIHQPLGRASKTWPQSPVSRVLLLQGEVTLTSISHLLSVP